jgi:protein SCO1/2
MVLEDQDGAKTTFKAFFCGQPSIVVFFYTRCDNPMKCSLTIAKLARVQALLKARDLAGRIRTAAFTYDPAFDLPDRLRIYGQDRGVRVDAGHRLFRATENNDALRAHFGLGVGFVGSLVNRHRVELYVLDASGRVAVSFEQLRWDEQEVVARAASMLE